MPFEPEALPRNAVRRIYDTIAHSSDPLTLDNIVQKCPNYTPSQVYWACGTMIRQGILKMGAAPRSDGRKGDPIISAVLPFEGYIGIEEAK